MSDLDVFDEFYGVVLTHWFGGPLLWSPTHRAWLRLVSREAGWADEPVEGDKVVDAELVAAQALATEFADAGTCERCGASARPQTHFIAIDVFGDPAVWCVQQPSPEVVGSRGGGGTKKHWGSPLACNAADETIISSALPGAGSNGIVAAFPHGRPLAADDVMLRGWCARCLRLAAGSQERDLEELAVTEHLGVVRMVSIWLRNYAD